MTESEDSKRQFKYSAFRSSVGTLVALPLGPTTHPHPVSHPNLFKPTKELLMKSPFAFIQSVPAFVLASAAITLLSCGSSQDVSNVNAAQSRPEWTIELQSSCSDVAAQNCLGGYTYSLGADGLYRVGPGPQGQMLSGKLSQNEFSQLQKLYFESIASARAFQGHAVCTPATANNDDSSSSDTVRWVPQTGSPVEWIRTSPKENCIQLATADAAQKVLAFLKDSASVHYPLPFPDQACDGASAALKALYANARGCKVDSDCAYIDEEFQPIAKNHFMFLITDDCTGAAPLVVGNAAYVASKRGPLLQALGHAKEACQNRSLNNCDGFSDFQPTEPAPICEGGLCRARRG
jgi:hypothetical protein